MGLAAAFGVAFLGAAVATTIMGAAIAWGALSLAAQGLEALKKAVTSS
jgi:hypothetical protein